MTVQLAYESELLDEHLMRAMGDAPLAHFRLEPIDELTGGVHGGRVYFITGGPGAGKTTLLGQLADELAAQGIVCVFYTLELAAHRIVAKSIARMGDLPLADISNPGRRADVVNAANAYHHLIASSMVYIDKPVSVIDLGSLIGKIKHGRNADAALLVDYVQVMPTSTALAEERLQIKEAVSDLRRIANTYDVPVIAISSVARGNYEKVPPLDKLGGSQALEYGADVVLCLTVDGDSSHEVATNATLPVRPIAATTIKSRYGQTGRTRLTFNAPCATFIERR